MNDFIKRLPKAELHVHIVGTLEPEMLMHIAKRNAVKLYNTTTEAKHAYAQFTTLDTFLKVYDQATRALQKEEDFYDITLAYLHKVAEQGVLRSEFFFETQNFEQLGVSFTTIINGITTAIAKAKIKYGISAAPILCFLRNMSEESTMHTYKQSLAYADVIGAYGLAANEKGNPPNKFKQLFQKIHDSGAKICVHAGEDMGAEYIWQAIRDLHADRIDHGVRCIEDPTLVEYLKETQLPLTVCPISNTLLNIFSAQNHPLKQLLSAGLNVSLHSDDPAFFGGYINENYAYAHTKMGLMREQLVQCARNSLSSSFADDEEKEKMLAALERFIAYM